jgi:glycosyltransferase involved in cell wall biosynthesis
MELLHNFTYGKRGMEAFGLANHSFLNKRITVDHVTAQNIREQYVSNNVDRSYNERIIVIEPGVDLPDTMPAKESGTLKILYAGRGGAQKRVWLIDRIARQCIAEGLPVEFHFAGDIEGELSTEVKSTVVLHGQISEPEQMKALYRQADAILLTSAYEGFPMFIKEGMANGCIPIVTALPGNRTHLHHQQNALLIMSVEDEEAVVKEGLQHIQSLLHNAGLKSQLQNSAFNYAKEHFDKKQFTEAYARLLS